MTLSFYPTPAIRDMIKGAREFTICTTDQFITSIVIAAIRNDVSDYIPGYVTMAMGKESVSLLWQIAKALGNIENRQSRGLEARYWLRCLYLIYVLDHSPAGSAE